MKECSTDFKNKDLGWGVVGTATMCVIPCDMGRTDSNLLGSMHVYQSLVNIIVYNTEMASWIYSG